MSLSRILLLMRHAEAEQTAPGRRDEQRVLTSYGHVQAQGVGEFFHSEPLQVQHALCSTATRTRETLADLGGIGTADFQKSLYTAGSDTILSAVQEISAAVEVALVVGHAPGIPALAHDLADPDSSDPQALETIGHRFGTATLVGLTFSGAWADLRSAPLTFARIPPPAGDHSS